MSGCDKRIVFDYVIKRTQFEDYPFKRRFYLLRLPS